MSNAVFRRDHQFLCALATPHSEINKHRLALLENARLDSPEAVAEFKRNFKLSWWERIMALFEEGIDNKQLILRSIMYNHLALKAAPEALSPEDWGQIQASSRYLLSQLTQEARRELLSNAEIANGLLVLKLPGSDIHVVILADCCRDGVAHGDSGGLGEGEILQVLLATNQKTGKTLLATLGSVECLDMSEKGIGGIHSMLRSVSDTPQLRWCDNKRIEARLYGLLADGMTDKDERVRALRDAREAWESIDEFDEAVSIGECEIGVFEIARRPNEAAAARKKCALNAALSSNIFEDKRQYMSAAQRAEKAAIFYKEGGDSILAKAAWKRSTEMWLNAGNATKADYASRMAGGNRAERSESVFRNASMPSTASHSSE